jgi:murein DD-endopeptidase MepM/ murein hydrolase activator NlpD
MTLSRTRITLAMAVALVAGCDAPAAETETATRAAAVSCKLSDLRITRFPLDGTNGTSFMIRNYVDLDPAPESRPGIGDNIRDYKNNTNGLARTYDKHEGLDIDLPSIREMDSGSAVVFSATPGKVTPDGVSQGADDRQKTLCTKNDPRGENFVKVEAPNGFIIRYRHLKKDSVKVTPGQTVQVGTPLGIAGSSGCSTQAHLHFQVNDCFGNIVETLLTDTVWSSPPVYDPPSGIMDVMLRPGASPTIDQIKDPVPNPPEMAPNTILGLGVSAAVRGGDTIAVSVVDPNGTNVSSDSWTDGGNARFIHTLIPFNAVPLSGVFGTWKVQVRLNGALKVTRTFKVGTQAARHGVPDDENFPKVVRNIQDAGFRPIWIDGYDVVGKTFFNLLFAAVDGEWTARAAMTAAEYQQEFTDRTGQGFRLVQVDSYLRAGQIAYAAVFDKTPSTPWTAYHGVSAADHVSRFNSLINQGFRPVNIAVVVSGGQRIFTALYDSTPFGGLVATIPSEAQFQSVFDANKAAGRRLAYVNGFLENGVPMISAIFDDQTRGVLNARHGMTAAQYQTELNTQVAQGLVTRRVTGYNDGTDHAHFAAIWTSP